MSDNVIPMPFRPRPAPVKVAKHHSGRQICDMKADMERERGDSPVQDKKIHAVCHYLRQLESSVGKGRPARSCEGCSHKDRFFVEGKDEVVTKACYALARECLAVALYADRYLPEDG